MKLPFLKARYSGKPIPLSIRKELETQLGCTSLFDLKGRAFTEALREINKTIAARYFENSEYQKYFKIEMKKAQAGKLKNNGRVQNTRGDGETTTSRGNTFFTAKSLHRYFEGEPIRSDKLQALLCFLKYDPAKLETGSKTKKKIFDNSYFEVLRGTWFSYVYDAQEPSSNKVKRTVLFLNVKNGQYLDVQYEGLRGRFRGMGEIVKNSLLFTIKNIEKDIHIFLCAELPIDGGDASASQMILNASCLANSLSGHPVMSNVIMVKSEYEDVNFDKPETIENFLRTKPVTLVYNSLKNRENQVKDSPQVAEWKEKEIIAYLFRNKLRNNIVRIFSPNSFEHLIYRNSKADQKNSHENYDKLKLKLNGHIFYAFNRFRQRRNEVAVFSYTFDFIDEERICIANRHPIGNPNKIEYTGEIFMKAEKIYMDLNDANMQHRKQFIAPFNCIPDNDSRIFVFRGVTSSVSTLTGNPMALRELIVGIPHTNNFSSDKSFITESDRTNGYISYDDFCNLPTAILKNEEKLFLANQSMSTLTFPAKTDTTFIYYRQDKARKYEGTYFLFTFSLQPEVSPLVMSLTIDRLSQVTLEIKYDSEENCEIYAYHGVCEYYNNSLRIGVHYSSEYPNDERHSEFIFDPLNEKNHKKPFILTGINLTTDDENKALAVRFIAIKNDWLIAQRRNKKLIEVAAPEIGLSNYQQLKNIEQLLNENGITALELSQFLLKGSTR